MTITNVIKEQKYEQLFLISLHIKYIIYPVRRPYVTMLILEQKKT